MTNAISAEYDGHAIIPDEPLPLAAGQRLRVTFEAVDEPHGQDLAAILPPELKQRADGSITVRGRRISLYLLLQDQADGSSEEEMQRRYPDVDAQTLQRIFEFCRRNPEQVRKYFDEQAAIAEQYCDSAHQGPSLDELRRRRAASGR